MFAWLKKLIGGEDCAPTRATRRPASPLRPLEVLERRENPARLIYNGTLEHSAFTDKDAWLDEATNLPPAQSPAPPDTVIADGTKSDTDLTFPNAGGVFAGFEVKDTYSKTVTFPANVTFGKYLQAGGHVSLVGGAGRTVTVVSADPANTPAQFVWTAGDILGAGKYELKGVLDSRIGFDTTTLETRASIILDRVQYQPSPWFGQPVSVGSQVPQYGTLKLRGGAGIEVKNHSIMLQTKTNQASTAGIILSNRQTLGDPGVVLWSNGTFASDGGSVPSVTNYAGTLDVRAGGLEVTGDIMEGDYGVVMMNAGSVTTIANGAKLEVKNGLLMLHGTLNTTYNSAPGGSQTVVIDGEFSMEGGLVQLGVGQPGPGTVYSSLLVKAKTKLRGGVFVTKLSSSNNQKRDFIETTDEFETSAYFIISPDGPAPSGGTSVLVSGFGFGGSGLPSVANSWPWFYTIAWGNNNKDVVIS